MATLLCSKLAAEKGRPVLRKKVVAKGVLVEMVGGNKKQYFTLILIMLYQLCFEFGEYFL